MKWLNFPARPVISPVCKSTSMTTATAVSFLHLSDVGRMSREGFFSNFRAHQTTHPNWSRKPGIRPASVRRRLKSLRAFKKNGYNGRRSFLTKEKRDFTLELRVVFIDKVILKYRTCLLSTEHMEIISAEFEKNRRVYILGPIVGCVFIKHPLLWSYGKVDSSNNW